MTVVGGVAGKIEHAASHALHGLVWVGLRVASPRTVSRFVRRVVRPVAWILPPLDEAAARALADELESAGTCLSRSLTISARLPNSRVVIGVQREDGTTRAHAWVEVKGEPLRGNDPRGEAIAAIASH